MSSGKVSFVILLGVLADLCAVHAAGEGLIRREASNKELFEDNNVLEMISHANVTASARTADKEHWKIFPENIAACGVDEHCSKSNVSKCGQIESAARLSDVEHGKANVTADTGDSAECQNNGAVLDTIRQNASIAFFSPHRLFETIPPFDLHDMEDVTAECRIQSAIYVKSLKLLEMWALKMYDASTKIPSGFLNGNVNQYGDIDQCLNVRHKLGETGEIKGQYCLASLQLSLSGNASDVTKEVFKLVHSHYAFRSKLTDPGHRVPRFSSITWAICVPSGCTPHDVETGIRNYVTTSDLENQMSAEIYVDPNMCQTQKDFKFSLGFYIASSVFILIIMICIIGTVGESVHSEVIPEWIRGFSAIKNIKSIFSLKDVSSSDEVKAVHGIRCLNAIMLLIAHKSMAVFFMPYMNRTQMAELLGEPWSVVGRTASLYTDPFIMFSGLLTCYSLHSRHSKGRTISILNEYVCRLFRLVPTMSALILFCTWILPEISSGPQWPLVITKHAQICKDTWWRNLLFIHNYFGFHNMCLTHTHHIGIDTQLFILGVPLSMWLITNTARLKRNVCILIIIATLSTIGRFYVSYTMELANFVSYGSSVSQLFRTADYMYIIPAYRITVYIIGMLLALVLRSSSNRKLSQQHIKLGWFVAVSLFLCSFLLPMPMGNINYTYSALSSALYASLAPIGWVLSFAWIIYTQHLGHNSWLGNIFSWRIFAVWTKLSYAIYLTQFPVFFYFVGTVRSPQYYTLIGETINVVEIFIVLVTSIILTLLFDIPFQNLRKILSRHVDKQLLRKKPVDVKKTVEKKSMYCIIREHISHAYASVITKHKLL